MEVLVDVKSLIAKVQAARADGTISAAEVKEIAQAVLQLGSDLLKLL